MAAKRRYWLLKSEPETYSIHDLAKEKGRRTHWDGVRNYQARNILRDDMKKGDGVLFYHSNAKPPAIVGTAVVVKEGYPDFTAFDPEDPHYDPKSSEDSPRWYMVDVRLEREFAEPLTLPALKEIPSLENMELLRRGSRLSVQPVAPAEWRKVLKLAGEKDTP